MTTATNVCTVNLRRFTLHAALFVSSMMILLLGVIDIVLFVGLIFPYILSLLTAVLVEDLFILCDVCSK